MLVHETLKNYLEPSRAPGSVVPPSAGLNARLPVGPAGSLPVGLRPIPASTQTNKKTNAQLPYVRKLVKNGGRLATEGDIVFIEREVVHMRKQRALPIAHAVAHSFDEVNELLDEQGAVAEAYTALTFPFPLDGVVNNVDGLDDGNEFRDHTLANVAVQGPCRMRTLGFEKSPLGCVLYVGVETKLVGVLYKHKLVKFSALTIFNGSYAPTSLAFAYQVGRVIDAAQSPSMVSVFVSIDTVCPIEVPPPGPPALEKEENGLWWNGSKWWYVARWTPLTVGDEVKPVSVQQHLENKWKA